METVLEKEKKVKSHKDYLKKKVNPVLEKLVLDLLIEKPENVVKEFGKEINQ